MIDIKKVQSELKEKLHCNLHALPRLEKIVLNIGLGKIRESKDAFAEAERTLAIITGQKPVTTKAKRAISGFKIRQGDPVGLMVTLRSRKMLSFIERLVKIALPRIRDFRGLPKDNFDSQGNYTVAFREHIIFPEVPYDKVEHLHGLQATFKIRNSNPEKSRVLLETFGAPFEKE